MSLFSINPSLTLTGSFQVQWAESPLKGQHPSALTCALLDSRPFLQGMPAQLAVKVVLPELSEPDVPPVVVQGATDEVAVKPC